MKFILANHSEDGGCLIKPPPLQKAPDSGSLKGKKLNKQKSAGKDAGSDSYLPQLFSANAKVAWRDVV